MDFDDFVDAHLPALTRYAGVLTGDRQLAHDLLADTLVMVAPKWSRIGRMEFPVAYVRRAITTTYLSDRRKVARRRTDSTDDPTVFDRPTPDESSAVGDRDSIRHLLAGLTPPQRAAVVMRFYLDLPDPDIAAALGCTAGTVRSHLSRGLASLRVAADASTKE